MDQAAMLVFRRSRARSHRRTPVKRGLWFGTGILSSRFVLKHALAAGRLENRISVERCRRVKVVVT